MAKDQIKHGEEFRSPTPEEINAYMVEARRLRAQYIVSLFKGGEKKKPAPSLGAGSKPAAA